MIPALFLYDNGPRQDLLLKRPLCRALAAREDLEIKVGVCRDDAALLADILAPEQLLVSDYANGPDGAVLDLRHLQPEGHVPIELWLDRYEGENKGQWCQILDLFEDRIRRLGLSIELGLDPREVPMLDFDQELPAPEIDRPTILIDDRFVPGDGSWFIFDLERILRVFPGHDLLCTRPQQATDPRIQDASQLDPIQLSQWSEACEVLVGRSQASFLPTLTEANRAKPKALCGYDARATFRIWDYPGNPLELLSSMDELMDFLLTNCEEGRGWTSC